MSVDSIGNFTDFIFYSKTRLCSVKVKACCFNNQAYPTTIVEEKEMGPFNFITIYKCSVLQDGHFLCVYIDDELL